jgi:hypothetical protein
VLRKGFDRANRDIYRNYIHEKPCKVSAAPTENRLIGRFSFFVSGLVSVYLAGALGASRAFV